MFRHRERSRQTYGNAVVILLANALGLGLALLERVLVLELGTHVGEVESTLWYLEVNLVAGGCRKLYK